MGNPREGREVIRLVDRRERHPQFDLGNPDAYDYDVALLRLSEPLPFSEDIQPACPPVKGELYEWTECMVTGWGALRFSEYRTWCKLNVNAKRIVYTITKFALI